MSNKYSYKIILNLEKDAWNWFDACNSSIQHGVVWSEKVPDQILDQVKDKPENEAIEFIIQFLKQKYIDDKDKIDTFTEFINKRYSENFYSACLKLEQVMKKPIYRNDFTIYLTTIPMAPYNYDLGYLFDYIGWDDPITGFLHELSHMQFIHYWRNNPDSDVSKLTDEQFEWLKESLTIILDEDFLPLIERPDKGYDIHKSYRKVLHKFWKTNHDFDKLVDFGLKILPDYINKKLQSCYYIGI